MKKQALAIALASVVGTFAAGAALAAPPPAPNPGPWTNPSLFNSERSGICLIESALSIVAANVAHFGCAQAAGSYYFNVGVDEAGKGSAELDGVVLTNTLGPRVIGKGQKCSVIQDPKYGMLFTPKTGAKVEGYAGFHVWNYTNTIFLDLAPGFQLAGVWYDEHSIKDFYKPVTKSCDSKSGGYCTPPTTEDYGLEVITKMTYPREKWWQTSSYTREDGTWDGGKVLITKKRVAPALSCTISLDLDGYNVSNEFYYTGAITVL
jgi:hypothetical protein